MQAPTTQVARITIAVSMPVSRASSGESDMARIALPILVWVRSQWTAAMIARAKTTISTCLGEMRKESKNT